VGLGVVWRQLFVLWVQQGQTLKGPAPGYDQVEAELKEAPGEDGQCEVVHSAGLLDLCLVEEAEQIDNIGGKGHVDKEKLGEGASADVAFGAEPAAEDY